MGSDGTNATNGKASELRGNSLIRNKTRNQKTQQMKEQALIGRAIDKGLADLGRVSFPPPSGSRKGKFLVGRLKFSVSFFSFKERKSLFRTESCVCERNLYRRLSLQLK